MTSPSAPHLLLFPLLALKPHTPARIPQAGELAMLTTDDGSSNPYKVRTADGFDDDGWILLTSLVPVDEAAAVR